MLVPKATCPRVYLGYSHVRTHDWGRLLPGDHTEWLGPDGLGVPGHGEPTRWVHVKVCGFWGLFLPVEGAPVGAESCQSPGGS